MADRIALRPEWTDEPAADTDAVVVCTDSFHFGIRGIIWSYDSDPVTGNLQITDADSVLLMSIDIIIGGPGHLKFDTPVFVLNKDLTVTLSAGGSGITGKLAVY